MRRLCAALLLVSSVAVAQIPSSVDAPTSGTQADAMAAFRQQIADQVRDQEKKMPAARQRARDEIAKLDVPTFICAQSDREAFEAMLRDEENPCAKNQRAYFGLLTMGFPNQSLALFQSADLTLDAAQSMMFLASFLNIHDPAGYWYCSINSPLTEPKPKTQFQELKPAYIRLVEAQPDASIESTYYVPLASYFITPENAALLERKGKWSGKNGEAARRRLFGSE